MEIVTTTALALGTIVATKALEKTGEEIGEAFYEKSKQFLASLRKQSPDTALAIEQAPDKPLDYGKAVLEIESAAQSNTKVAQSVKELAELGKTSSLSNLAEILKKIEKSVKDSNESYPENFIQNIQKAINVAQNQTIDQRGSTFI